MDPISLLLLGIWPAVSVSVKKVKKYRRRKLERKHEGDVKHATDLYSSIFVKTDECYGIDDIPRDQLLELAILLGMYQKLEEKLRKSLFHLPEFFTDLFMDVRKGDFLPYVPLVFVLQHEMSMRIECIDNTLDNIAAHGPRTWSNGWRFWDLKTSYSSPTSEMEITIGRLKNQRKEVEDLNNAIRLFLIEVKHFLATSLSEIGNNKGVSRYAGDILLGSMRLWQKAQILVSHSNGIGQTDSPVDQKRFALSKINEILPSLFLDDGDRDEYEVLIVKYGASAKLKELNLLPVEPVISPERREVLTLVEMLNNPVQPTLSRSMMAIRPVPSPEQVIEFGDPVRLLPDQNFDSTPFDVPVVNAEPVQELDQEDETPESLISQIAGRTGSSSR